MTDETESVETKFDTLTSCIVCDKELKSIWESNDKIGAGVIQPNGAVSFFGSGAYGSNFDESPEYVINICDDCLQGIINSRKVAIHHVETFTEHSYEIPKPANE